MPVGHEVQVPVKDAYEKLVEALGDPRWDWRSLSALNRETGVSESEILNLLASRTGEVELRSSPDHGVIFRLRVRPQRDRSILQEALDSLSLRKRSA